MLKVPVGTIKVGNLGNYVPAWFALCRNFGAMSTGVNSIGRSQGVMSTGVNPYR